MGSIFEFNFKLTVICTILLISTSKHMRLKAHNSKYMSVKFQVKQTMGSIFGRFLKKVFG